MEYSVILWLNPALTNGAYDIMYIVHIYMEKCCRALQCTYNRIAWQRVKNAKSVAKQMQLDNSNNKGSQDNNNNHNNNNNLK